MSDSPTSARPDETDRSVMRSANHATPAQVVSRHHALEGTEWGWECPTCRDTDGGWATQAEAALAALRHRCDLDQQWPEDSKTPKWLVNP